MGQVVMRDLTSDWLWNLAILPYKGTLHGLIVMKNLLCCLMTVALMLILIQPAQSAAIDRKLIDAIRKGVISKYSKCNLLEATSAYYSYRYMLAVEANRANIATEDKHWVSKVLSVMGPETRHYREDLINGAGLRTVELVDKEIPRLELFSMHSSQYSCVDEWYGTLLAH